MEDMVLMMRDLENQETGIQKGLKKGDAKNVRKDAMKSLLL